MQFKFEESVRLAEPGELLRNRSTGGPIVALNRAKFVRRLMETRNFMKLFTDRIKVIKHSIVGYSHKLFRATLQQGSEKKKTRRI